MEWPVPGRPPSSSTGGVSGPTPTVVPILGHGHGRVPGLRSRRCPASAAPESSRPHERSFAGYGAWVGRFLDAVGVDNVALAAGHSFGGGVAAAFVHRHPERVSSLLLANAVGGPTWADFPDELRTMVQRPVWDWVHQMSTDVMASPWPRAVAPDPGRGLRAQSHPEPARHVPDG